MLGYNVLDVIWALLSECLMKSLSALFTLGREAVNVFAVDFRGLLAMTDEVNYWMSLLHVSALIHRGEELGA